MAKQSVDALYLKDVQLGLGNGQKPTSDNLTRDILLRDVKLFGFMKKRFHFAMSKPTVLFIFCILI